MEILFGAGQNGVRGGLQCAQPSMCSSASCLRFDDNWWWSGFTIGSYLIDFSVALNITTYTSSGGGGSNSSTAGAPPPPAKSGAGPPIPAPSGGSSGAGPVTSRSEMLRVTPAQPFVLDSQQLLSAQLLGDLSGYAQVEGRSRVSRR